MSLISREPIEVLAMFKAGKIEPLRFKWDRRAYEIQRVDLTFSERKGRDKLSYFSVYDGTNTFRLAYSTEAQQWYLETEDTLF